MEWISGPYRTKPNQELGIIPDWRLVRFALTTFKR